MLGTIPGDSTWCDLTPFRYKISQRFDFLIVDHETAVRTKLTYFSSVSPSESIPTVICVTSSSIHHLRPLAHLLIQLALHCLLLEPGLPWPQYLRLTMIGFPLLLLSRPQDQLYYSI